MDATYPVIGLRRTKFVVCLGNALGGVGAVKQQSLPPGDYFLVVSGGEVLVCDGARGELDATADVPLREGPLVAPVRLESGTLSVACSTSDDATLFVIPVVDVLGAAAGRCS